MGGAYPFSTWENVRYSGYDAMGILQSPWLAGHSGTLYAYVYRRDVHAVKIGELKQQKLHLENELQQIGSRVYKLEAEVSKKRNDWDRLSKQISLLSAVSADLKQAHISLEEYLSTRDLYVQPTTLSDKDLFDMYLKRKQSAIEKIVSNSRNKRIPSPELRGQKDSNSHPSNLGVRKCCRFAKTSMLEN